MDINTLERRYMRIVKVCAILAGVWPGQSKLSKYITRTIVYTASISSLCTQTARIVYYFSLEVLIEQFCFYGTAMGILIKQLNYVINAAKYEALIKGIRKDWSNVKSKEEIKIMTTYAERGHFFVQTYFTNCTICLLFFVQMPLTPRILDMVLPKNESRDLGYVYPAYYLVDEYKYHAIIVSHMLLVTCVVLYVFVACDASLMYTVQHACGLLAVSGHRFEAAVKNLSAVERKCAINREVYRKVCHSVKGHQHALRYLKSIQSTHDAYLFLCVGMVMACFSVTLVKISHMNVCPEFAKDCAFAVIQLVHIFYLTIQGQFVINSNDYVIHAISGAEWYHSDKRTQLLFVLALRSCISPPRITAGGLITLNLESFSEIVKASVSYFMVLKST